VGNSKGEGEVTKYDDKCCIVAGGQRVMSASHSPMVVQYGGVGRGSTKRAPPIADAAVRMEGIDWLQVEFSPHHCNKLFASIGSEIFK
jgi:hypothetical protein